jgi:hypothetical protein
LTWVRLPFGVVAVVDGPAAAVLGSQRLGREVQRCIVVDGEGGIGAAGCALGERQRAVVGEGEALAVGAGEAVDLAGGVVGAVDGVVDAPEAPVGAVALAPRLLGVETALVVQGNGGAVVGGG